MHLSDFYVRPCALFFLMASEVKADFLYWIRGFDQRLFFCFLSRRLVALLIFLLSFSGW